MVDKLFLNGQLIYQGYVDDPRNTDNSWMETTVYHYHCNMELGSKIPLKAGDDADDVIWLDVNDNDQRYKNLYASHKDWVDNVAIQMKKDVI